MRILVGIYQILNIATGKFYIGKSVNIILRWANHKCYLRRGLSKNPYLQSAWNKYGEAAFEFIVIELCDKENITKREQYWIDNLGACDRELGYNSNPNAENSLGAKCSNETKAKISAANKGNKWSAEAKLNAKGRKINTAKIIETKIRNGTLSTEKSRQVLKGNLRRREKEKWPHPWGVKCSCAECIQKKRDYQKLRYDLKKHGEWGNRELSYQRRKVAVNV